MAGLGRISDELTDRGLPEQPAGQVTIAVQQSAGTAVAGLPAQPGGDVLFAGASEGFADAVTGVWRVAAGLIGLGLLSAFLLPKDVAHTEAAGYAD